MRSLKHIQSLFQARNFLGGFSGPYDIAEKYETNIILLPFYFFLLPLPPPRFAPRRIAVAF
jgi:hypothetical protein